MSPLAVLTKLAALLRSVPAVRLVFAKFETLLRNKESGELLTSEFSGEASDATRSTVHQHAAVLQPSSAGYDTLEFKMVRSYVNEQTVNLIVCEGVVVDPPKHRVGRLLAGTPITKIGT